MSSCFLCYSGFTLKILFCRREGSRFLVECSRHSGRSFDLYSTKIISYTSVSRPVLIKEGRILRCSKTSLILSSSDKWSMFSNFCVLAFYHREAHREKSHLWCLVLSQAKESASYPVEATVSGCGSWGWWRWCWASGWISWSWRSLAALVILWNAGNLMQCTQINECTRKDCVSTLWCDVGHTEPAEVGWGRRTLHWHGETVTVPLSPCCHKQNLSLCAGSGPDVLMWHSGVQPACVSAHFLISAQSF